MHLGVQVITFVIISYETFAPVELLASLLSRLFSAESKCGLCN